MLVKITRSLVLVARVAFRTPGVDIVAEAAAEQANTYATQTNGELHTRFTQPSRAEVPTVLAREEEGTLFESLAESAGRLAAEAPSVLAERIETLTLLCAVLQVGLLREGAAVVTVA